MSEWEGKRRGFVLSQASTPYAKEATFPRGAVASVATTVFLSSSLAGSITDTKQAHKFCDFKADTAKEELFFLSVTSSSPSFNGCRVLTADSACGPGGGSISVAGCAACWVGSAEGVWEVKPPGVA